MSDRESLSKRVPLRFWGWGYESEELSPEEDRLVASAALWFLAAGAVEIAPPGACGGVKPDVGESYQGTINRVAQHFDRVVKVDTTGRRASIPGPDLEAALKPHGLNLRHNLRSFRFSTLSGWIAK